MRTALAILAIAASALASNTCKRLPGKQTTGLAVHAPEAKSEVPVGKPFTITWDATGGGTVSILLLRGPSTNVVPHSCIVDSTPNTGTYTWTPPTTLENDKTHYGIQIIADDSGAFQYSTQFGISNPRGVAAAAAAPAPSDHSANATTPPNHLKSSTHASASASATGAANSTNIIQPTKSMSVPTTLQPLGTSAAGAASTTTTAPATTGSGTASAKAGAAARVVGGGVVLAGLGAVAALML